MQLKQVVPPGKQFIQSYREDGFTINGIRYTGAVFVLPDRTIPWDHPAPLSKLAIMALEAVMQQPLFDFVLFGTGARVQALPASLLAETRKVGLKLEPMATPAACRTYNLLVSENRHIAAALLPAASVQGG